MDFKIMVKKLRNKLLLTQQEMAELLGVSYTSINRWENGVFEPTIKMKRKIVELCKKNKIDLGD